MLLPQQLLLVVEHSSATSMANNAAYLLLKFAAATVLLIAVDIGQDDVHITVTLLSIAAKLDQSAAVRLLDRLHHTRVRLLKVLLKELFNLRGCIFASPSASFTSANVVERLESFAHGVAETGAILKVMVVVPLVLDDLLIVEGDVVVMVWIIINFHLVTADILVLFFFVDTFTLVV